MTDRESAECAARTKVIRENYERQITQIDHELNDRLSEIMSNFYYDKYGRKIYAQNVQRDTTNTQRSYDAKKMMIRQQMQSELDVAQKYFNDRKTALEEYATNADRAYVNRQKESAKVAPLGTNLYNRNYETYGEP